MAKDRFDLTTEPVEVPYKVAHVPSLARDMTSTTFELSGYRVVNSLGVVRGITVRSRSIFGTIGAAFQTLKGGNITLLTQLCERARAEAFEIMLHHAEEIGANAVLGIRYDATEIMSGVTEVLAHGTAVVVVPIEKKDENEKIQ
jgi:uncharacterized protein YbjQ (UPF0145 family)